MRDCKGTRQGNVPGDSLSQAGGNRDDEAQSDLRGLHEIELTDLTI